MVISVEDMFLDKPINEVLRKLLVLDDNTSKVHSSYEGYDFCIFSFGKLFKFSPVESLVNRSACGACFTEHFTDEELKDYKNFVLCNITFKGSFFDEKYLSSDWYMEYLEFRSNYKKFSRDSRKIVLFVPHFHQKGENGGFVYPHIHVLYNNFKCENVSYYSCHCTER